MFAQGRSEYGGEETGGKFQPTNLERKKLKGKKGKKVLTKQWTRGQHSPSSVPRSRAGCTSVILLFCRESFESLLFCRESFESHV